MSKGWDNATLKKLKSLMGKGLSTSEMGKRLGISKNAVVGKLNRLGWNSKAGGAPTATSSKGGASATKKSAKATAKNAAPKKTTTSATKTTKKPVASGKTATKKPAMPAKKSVSPVQKVKSTTATTKSDKSLTKNLAMHQRIIQHSLEMANLKPNQCRWPIGDPDSENFHFCGEQVFVGKPYCYEHCKQAYQFTPPKKK